MFRLLKKTHFKESHNHGEKRTEVICTDIIKYIRQCKCEVLNSINVGQGSVFDIFMYSAFTKIVLLLYVYRDLS